MKKALFGDEYCEQQTTIIEAVFSNSQKYTHKDREPLLEHIEKCSICYEYFLNHETCKTVKSVQF